MFRIREFFFFLSSAIIIKISREIRENCKLANFTRPTVYMHRNVANVLLFHGVHFRPKQTGSLNLV